MMRIAHPAKAGHLKTVGEFYVSSGGVAGWFRASTSK